ncbi:uncharacterized protein LOC106771948 isoform X2 [Vigna radiata var. radiata]|uniref:Uncharacterized protein LOC106771948 isoform X2 n=1 Tax=Vigna radiata var. radiata TaxID=3916 RepID=A0A1S3V5E3_VIGRR|nr:uncharacterized protein LOC106771948 isoform X2 [Vigna radiata var. radiata]
MAHNLFVPMAHRVFFNIWPSLSRYCFLFAGIALHKLLSLEDDHHHEDHKEPQALLYGPFSAATEHTSNLGLCTDRITPNSWDELDLVGGRKTGPAREQSRCYFF